MALQKSHTLPSDVSGNYWKVAQITFDAKAGILNALVELYKDQAARTAEKQPMLQQFHVFTGVTAAATEVEANVVAYVYEQLKLLADFDSATDV